MTPPIKYVKRELRYAREKGQMIDNNYAVKWYFLIINKASKIREIKSKIITQLENIFDEQPLAKGVLEGSNGIQYEAFSLESLKGYINFNKVYIGKTEQNKYKVKIDPQLSERKKQFSLEDYILRSIVYTPKK